MGRITNAKVGRVVSVKVERHNGGVAPTIAVDLWTFQGGVLIHLPVLSAAELRDRLDAALKDFDLT